MHGIDMFAKPIGLKFNKKPAFTTVPGGFCSILVIGIFTSFVIINGIQFFLYSAPSDVTSVYRVKHVDVREFKLGPN